MLPRRRRECFFDREPWMATPCTCVYRTIRRYKTLRIRSLKKRYVAKAGAPKFLGIPIEEICLLPTRAAAGVRCHACSRQVRRNVSRLPSRLAFSDAAKACLDGYLLDDTSASCPAPVRQAPYRASMAPCRMYRVTLQPYCRTLACWRLLASIFESHERPTLFDDAQAVGSGTLRYVPR